MVGSSQVTGGSNLASDEQAPAKFLEKLICPELEKEMLHEQRVIEGMFGDSFKKFSPINQIRDAISTSQNLSQ